MNGRIRSILITRGAFAEIYEPAWCRALEEIGVRCSVFDAHSLTLPGLFGRLERRVLWGPGIGRVRRELLAKVRRERPDVTLLYQGHYYDRETVDRLRQFTFVAGFHNDDPFGTRSKMLRYRHLLPALSHYQGFHVYRSCNIQEAFDRGVKRAQLLRPYYLPWLDYPRVLEGERASPWDCDLVFAGHVEPDYRVECLAAAVRAGVSTRIYGDARFWKSALPRDVRERVPPVRKVIGEEYRLALCGAKIAACFFSRWNRDQYTRRAFEIPACGVFLLSERTSEMQALLAEGEEAEFFSSPAEFQEKVHYYLGHDTERERIALAGHRRITTCGHDIHARMRQWLSDVSCWREED